MGYVFISYSSKDQDMANSLRKLFMENSVDCWMAPYDIPAGTKYAYVINDAIKGCACLCLVLSDAAQNSVFVEKEVERALSNGKTVIPVMIEDVVLNSGFEFYLGNQQIVAIHTLDKNSPEVIRILNSIMALAGISRKISPTGEESTPSSPMASQGDIGEERGSPPDNKITCPQGEPLKQKGYLDSQTVCEVPDRLEQFWSLAQQGDAEAQYQVGECYCHALCGELNYTEAVKWYQKAAEQGHVKAQFQLGECNYWYHIGDNIRQDYAKAAMWYRKAAEQGHIDAKYRLGCYYYDQKNYSEAIKWYREAAEQGHIDAQNSLGNHFCYSNENYIEAIKWYQKAAEQGDFQALLCIGWCYYEHENYVEAVNWFHKFVENNKDHSLSGPEMILGECYYYGKGVQQDYVEALKWWRKAHVSDTNTLAQLSLGFSYYRGEGVQKDYTEARKWFRRAANRGSTTALMELGNCYYDGIGVKQDYTKAVRWYQKAAEQRMPDNLTIQAEAQKKLGDCYYHGKGVQQNYSDAVKWYRKAVENDNDTLGVIDDLKFDAQKKLGDCYYHGWGVQQNYAEAAKWYQKVIERGDAESEMKLGDCYFWGGTGIQQDRTEAEKWYQKAAASGDADFKEKLANHRKENERQARRKNFENLIRKFASGGRKEQ